MLYLFWISFERHYSCNIRYFVSPGHTMLAQYYAKNAKNDIKNKLKRLMYPWVISEDLEYHIHSLKIGLGIGKRGGFQKSCYGETFEVIPQFC